MSASASSSLAAGIAPAAAITDRLAPRSGDAAAAGKVAARRRWMLLPKDAEGVGACDEEGVAEEEVEAMKVGDART